MAANDLFWLKVVGGVSLSALGGILFSESSSRRAEAALLVDTPWTPISRIEAVLKTAEAQGRTATLVKIHGRVGCLKPLVCRDAKEADGSALQAAVVEREVTGYWVPRTVLSQESFLVSRDREEAKVFVQDEGGNRVFVSTWPNNPELAKAHERVEPGSNLLLSAFCGLFRFPVGNQYVHTESVLRMGDDMLALGRVSRARTGEVTMQNPNSGGGLFDSGYGVVSLKEEAELVAGKRREAFFLALGGTLLGAPGAYLLYSAATTARR